MTPPVTPHRRTGDRPEWTTTLAGFLCILAAIALRVFGLVGEWQMLAVAVLGGVLIKGESVLGFARIWRRKP